MRRFLILALVALALACAPVPPVTLPAPARTFQMVPPDAYTAWLLEVQFCARQIAALDSSFAIERTYASAAELVWRVAVTEAENGTYLTMLPGHVVVPVWGTSRADTIVLSSQVLALPRFVKHELLHAIVRSSTERDRAHGTPWGLCEFQ